MVEHEEPPPPVSYKNFLSPPLQAPSPPVPGYERSTSPKQYDTLTLLKDESSDESTVISSQTSTLTRHEGKCTTV